MINQLVKLKESNRLFIGKITQKPKVGPNERLDFLVKAIIEAYLCQPNLFIDLH